MKFLTTVFATLFFAISAQAGPSYVKEIKGTNLASLDNAFEVLKRISVLSESNGVFYVTGQEEAIVYVDGRRLNSHSDLLMIPAKDVDRVEVITEPRVEYGNKRNIVLVTTLKPSGNEFNLENTAKLTAGPLAGGSNDFEVSGRKNKILYEGGLVVDYSATEERNKRFEDLYAASPTNGAQWLNNRTMKDFNDVNRDLDVKAKVGMGYFITTEHQIHLRYEYSHLRSRNKWEDLHFNVFRRNNGAIDLLNPTESYNASSSSDSDKDRHYVSLGYEGKAGQWKLAANIDLYGVIRNNTSLEYEFTGGIGKCTYNKKETHKYVENFIRMEASHFLWKGDIKLGLAMDDYLQSTFSDDRTVDNDLIRAKTYIFDPMAFASLNQTFGLVNVDAGLMYQVDINAYKPFGDDQTAEVIREKTGSTDIKYNRHFVQPHITVSAKTGETLLSAGMYSSTSLPDFTDVSIKVDKIEGTDATKALPQMEEQLSAFVKGSWDWVDFKGWTTRYILPIFQNVDGEFDFNGPDYWSMDYRLTLSPKVAFWETSLTATLHKQWLNMATVAPIDDLCAPMGIFQWNNRFETPWGMKFDMNVFLRTEGADRNAYYRKPSWKIDASIQQNFLGDHLTVSISVDNLAFRCCDNIAIYKDAHAPELYSNERYIGRMFLLSLRYTM